jgi:LDH2 family malate/lactate/ureidoglycolate dehydrogenase
MAENDKDMPEGFGQVIAAIDEIKTIAAATSKNGEEFESKMKEIDTRVEEMEKKVKERKVSLPGVEDEKQKWSWANALSPE